MKLTELLDTYNLEKSVLIGYYGGGNYGDELLLEVLANMLLQRGIHHVAVTYQTPQSYKKFHHDFGYPLVLMSDRRQLLRSITKSKNIIVGGGGLWGLDVNPNIFLLSFLLFISHLFLRKKVFLLGVGYYNSTPRLGHISAWLAGKSATHIIARDTETLENFQKIGTPVSLDTDMAWHIPELNLSTYQEDVERLAKDLAVHDKTIFITLRRFKAHQQNSYTDLIEEFLQNNSSRNIIVSLMEPRDVDPGGYALLTKWQKQYTNVQIADFAYNPLALFLFFRQHREKLTLIGPQFHIIITAHLAGVPFLPIAYDNKVTRLIEYLDKKPIPINQLSSKQLQQFSDKFVKNRR